MTRVSPSLAADRNLLPPGDVDLVEPPGLPRQGFLHRSGDTLRVREVTRPSDLRAAVSAETQGNDVKAGRVPPRHQLHHPREPPVRRDTPHYHHLLPPGEREGPLGHLHHHREGGLLNREADVLETLASVE